MIDTSFDPMPSVDSALFKERYLNLLTVKGQDLTSFYKILEPFIQTLVSSFKKLDESYYFVFFLLKNIKTFGLQKQHIQQWTKENSFEADVNYIILSRLRKIKTIPHNAKPRMAKFYFVTDLRLAFSNYLKKKYNKNKYKIYKSIEPEFYEHCHKPKINSNFWQNYLFYMLKSGYTVTELSKITGYSRTTIYKELNK